MSEVLRRIGDAAQYLVDKLERSSFVPEVSEVVLHQGLGCVEVAGGLRMASVFMTSRRIVFRVHANPMRWLFFSWARQGPRTVSIPLADIRKMRRIDWKSQGGMRSWILNPMPVWPVLEVLRRDGSRKRIQLADPQGYEVRLRRLGLDIAFSSC